MLNRINRDGLVDRAAMLLSGLCAVHCLVSAVLVAVLASAGGILLDPIIHEVGLMIAILLGAVALGYGALRHGYMMPLAIGSLGIGVMMGALELPHDGSQVFYTIVGVAILALGHDLNYRATH
ncbi:MerC domain-containing protein [Sphingorhabdus sp. Alg239-R122]|uniref:MerC domain-containing protein n=1 Tax=Sphingorhabdus sp. Alg239-R122 TaxID=2305989 RepID=UPI0013DAE75C|nr:MerC domain-containing protein [Sphingorhabdus sp. Alg239-R122]